MQTPRHLVCGTDFSEFAERGLDLAIRLAIAPRARVTLVHVCELDADVALDELRLLQQGDALAEAVARYGRYGVEITGVLRSGKPWQKLDNVAAEVGASLIVVGRHGAGRGPAIEIGSVAERLVRSASRPVLTVACFF